MRKTFRQSGRRNNWSNPDNWNPRGVPSANDNVFIGSTDSVAIDCHAKVGTLEIRGEASRIICPMPGSITVVK